MPKQNFRDLSDEDLKAQLRQKKQDLLKLKFQLSANKMLQKSSNIKKLKTDIAKIMTILTERNIHIKG